MLKSMYGCHCDLTRSLTHAALTRFSYSGDWLPTSVRRQHSSRWRLSPPNSKRATLWTKQKELD